MRTSRAFLKLSEGNELAAERPSPARRAVAVMLAALFMISVPLFWAGGADAGKVVRPAASGPGHDGSGGHDDDNSGPGNGDDDDDTSFTSRGRDTRGTTNGDSSTRSRRDATSRRDNDTRGTTGGTDSTRTRGTGTRTRTGRG